MKQFALTDYVSGFSVNVLLSTGGDYMCLAMRMQRGEMVVASFDAEFCYNARDAIRAAVTYGGFDPMQRLGSMGAALEVSRFRAVRQAIPRDVWHTNLADTVAGERGLNLVESTALELDFVLRSGLDRTVWLDEIGAIALSAAVLDCSKRGMQDPRVRPSAR